MFTSLDGVALRKRLRRKSSIKGGKKRKKTLFFPLSRFLLLSRFFLPFLFPPLLCSLMYACILHICIHACIKGWTIFILQEAWVFCNYRINYAITHVVYLLYLYYVSNEGKIYAVYAQSTIPNTGCPRAYPYTSHIAYIYMYTRTYTTYLSIH